jgi:hypothetical protein
MAYLRCVPRYSGLPDNSAAKRHKGLSGAIGKERWARWVMHRCTVATLHGRGRDAQLCAEPGRSVHPDDRSRPYPHARSSPVPHGSTT